jgi:hypothetical protein
VQEYWILDPLTLAHRFYHKSGESLVQVSRREKTIRSRVIQGFWVRRKWLDPAALPSVRECLKEILANGG